MVGARHDWRSISRGGRSGDPLFALWRRGRRKQVSSVKPLAVSWQKPSRIFPFAGLVSVRVPASRILNHAALGSWHSSQCTRRHSRSADLDECNSAAVRSGMRGAAARRNWSRPSVDLVVVYTLGGNAECILCAGQQVYTHCVKEELFHPKAHGTSARVLDTTCASS
jgi:hypothetical protein